MQNDLISRSALLGKRTRMTEYDETGCGVHVFVISEEDVQNAPAVDAEPVRHARWDDGVCTNCGLDAMCFMDSHIQVYTDYCPHCGVRMDGDPNGKEKAD